MPSLKKSFITLIAVSVVATSELIRVDPSNSTLTETRILVDKKGRSLKTPKSEESTDAPRLSSAPSRAPTVSSSERIEPKKVPKASKILNHLRFLKESKSDGPTDAPSVSSAPSRAPTVSPSESSEPTNNAKASKSEGPTGAPRMASVPSRVPTVSPSEGAESNKVVKGEKAGNSK